MIIAIEIYMGIALFLGFTIALYNERFKKMSFWKQLFALSISPLLLAREIYKSIKGGK